MATATETRGVKEQELAIVPKPAGDWLAYVRPLGETDWQLLAECKSKVNARAKAEGFRDGSLPEQEFEIKVERRGFERYEFEGHCLPTKALVDAHDDPLALVWSIWVRLPGEEWDRAHTCESHDEALGFERGIKDHEPGAEVEIRPDCCPWVMIERQHAVARAAAGLTAADGPFWSNHYHDQLVKVEELGGKVGLDLFVDEESPGDECGRIEEKTRVGLGGNLYVPTSDNMAPAILAALRKKVERLERAFRKAGLV